MTEPIFTYLSNLEVSPQELFTHKVGLDVHWQNFNAQQLQKKNTFLYGRMAAYNSLLKLTNNKYPYLPKDDQNLPIWPKDIIGSISHTDKFSIAVSTFKKNYYSVGIDCEKILTTEKIKKLSSYFFTKKDLSYLNTYNSNYNLVASLLISFKEALYKAIHIPSRIYLDFSDIELEEIDLNNNFISASILKNGVFKNRIYSGKFFHKENYIITSCEIL